MKYDCPDMMNLLVEYLEGELDDEKRAELELHLELCPPCVNFVESYKKTGEMCRNVLEKKMPPELKTNLRAFLHKKCCRDDD